MGLRYDSINSRLDRSVLVILCFVGERFFVADFLYEWFYDMVML